MLPFLRNLSVAYILWFQGIKYFASMELLEHTPEGVAKFLIENAEGLDKVKLGQYLCKG